MSWSPPKAPFALIITTVFADMTEFFAFGAAANMSVRMESSDSRGCGEFLPICMNFCVKLFEILDDSLSCEMARNIIGDDREFLGVSDSIKNAMSNGGGDSSYYNGVETKDVVVLIS
jgi:hypothetical protein